MRPTTERLWAEQDRHQGDRHRMFRAVGDAVPVRTVLYPGCFVDVAASFVWPSVTYVDIDRRARRFFDDADGVLELIARAEGAPLDPTVTFLAADYQRELPLADESFDLLISLYTGPMARRCTRYVRLGGWLLANTSHGDVALAALDERWELSATVQRRSDRYAVDAADLDAHLVPKRGEPPTIDEIERSGRGVAYTRTAAAYLFRRVR